MKPTLTALFVAVALSLAAAGTQAANGPDAGHGASSVADMLQSKQDAKLRAQFVLQGRADDVQKLDAATAHNQQAQRDQRYLRVNQDLARGTGVDGQPIDVRALDCEPDAMKIR